VSSASSASRAAYEFATGEIVVLNRLVKRQDNAAGRPIEAVHGDAVENTGSGVEGDLALLIGARNNVIIARDSSKRADAAAGVNSEQCIEAAADRVNRDR